MHVAAEAEAPVLLVGDIDRGGVFAHLVGTMELLAPADRARVAGFLINKFRGDLALLAPGLEFLRARFQIPVLGVIPYVERLRIADEDSVALEDRRNRRATGLRSNRYRGDTAPAHLELRRLSRARARRRRDRALRRGTWRDSRRRPRDNSGIEEHRCRSRMAPRKRVRAGDRRARARGRSDCRNLRRMPDAGRANRGSASGRVGRGFGARPRPAADSHALRKNQAHRASARARRGSFDLERRDIVADEISAYEIHMGSVERVAGTAAPFRIVARNGAPADTLDGAINRDGTVAGTMLHGIFENDALRAAFLGALRRRKGLAAQRWNAARRLARGGIRSPRRGGRGQCRSADAPKDSRARLIRRLRRPPRHPRREILELPP